jgi:hypothetical protein
MGSCKLLGLISCGSRTGLGKRLLSTSSIICKAGPGKRNAPVSNKALPKSMKDNQPVTLGKISSGLGTDRQATEASTRSPSAQLERILKRDALKVEWYVLFLRHIEKMDSQHLLHQATTFKRRNIFSTSARSSSNTSDM